MKRLIRLLGSVVVRPVGRARRRHPREVFWLTWGTTWVAAVATMAVLFGLWDLFTSRDLSRFSRHGNPVMSTISVLMLASSLATFVATRVCRRLGLSLEAESAAGMRQRGRAPMPADASVIIRRPWMREVGESALILLLAIGLLFASRLTWLNPPDALPLWPLAVVLGLLGVAAAGAALLGRRRGDQGIALADKHGVRLSALPHAEVIPWEQIGGCTVETKRGVLGDTTRMRIHLLDHAGRVLGVVDLDRVPSAQQDAVLALVRIHHGLPARESVELEASLPAEGTGVELEASAAPAGRGTELEASGGAGSERQRVRRS